MRRRMIVMLALVALSLAPAGAAMAQGTDLPGMGTANKTTGTSSSTAGSGSGNLPGLGTVGAAGRGATTAPRPAPRKAAGAPTRLPATGSDATTLTIIAVALLAGGRILLSLRSRLV